MWLDCKHEEALATLSLKFVHSPTLKFTSQLNNEARERGCEDLTIHSWALHNFGSTD